MAYAMVKAAGPDIRDTQPSVAEMVLKRQEELESIRQGYEPVWTLVQEFVDPDGQSINFRGRSSYLYENQAANTERRGSRIYTNTAGLARDRLASGMESLITPQGDKWHGYSTASRKDEETQQEKEWAEKLRDYQFDIRYSSAANFVPAIQNVYRNVVTYGPAYLYPEPAYGDQPIYYCSIPINEGFVARNRYGDVDIFHRRYSKTARQVAQMLGWKNLPPIIKDMANDSAKQFTKVELIQAIQPRNERRMYDRAGEQVYLDKPFVSYHVLEQDPKVVKEGEFSSFPVACFNWRRSENDDYGLSPIISALVTVREINEVRRTSLRALQMNIDPPMGGKAELDYVPSFNPGEYYPGMRDEVGNQLVGPINTGMDANLGFQYAQSREEEVRDILMINLFQILKEGNPNQTATEVLVQREEKGELLGPAGSIIQRGIAATADRELAILEEDGLYDADSEFVPPESLDGKKIKTTFTSPLDILRKSAEARDTIQVVTQAAQFAQAAGDPSIMDNIDGDEALKVIQSAGRSPQRIMRSPEEVEERRAARAKQAEAQAGAQALQGLAKTAKDAVPALDQARASGMLDGLQNMMPQGNA